MHYDIYILKPYYLSIYLYTYKTLITLIVCLFVAVRTNPGYGMATLIYNNLLNLISGTVILLSTNTYYSGTVILFIFNL